jgi:hypothetical protein
MRPSVLVFFILALVTHKAVADSPVVAQVGQVCDSIFLNEVSIHADGTMTHDITNVADAAKECVAVGEGHCVIVNVCESMRRIAAEQAKPPAHIPGTTDL